ncbi:MAG: DUF6600 domain-containing protein, partial [Bryobacteraceae bacterium]
DDSTEQISLSEGTLTVRLRRLQDGETYEIDTPNVAITLQQPGAYRIDADPNNQTTTLTVWGGSAEATGGGQTFTVNPREQAVINGDQQITYNVQGAPGADAWDNWSGGRDRLRDQSMSAHYVSPEISGYDDLDANGRWASTPDYGQVWYPTTVAAGWAPYQHGHWAWISPWGWTWVDDAPWGFAPFHYGRWANINGAWGWCPGPVSVRPVYAPALVAWVGGGGAGFGAGFAAGAAAVGWFALGPREPFFPAYRVSSGYFTNVNVSNTVINRTVVNNYYNTTYINNRTNITNVTYANQRVRGAVVAVNQTQFASGQSMGRVARVIPATQVQRIGVMAAPAIAPQRVSVLGVHAATASNAPRPPANIVARQVVARATPPAPPVAFARQQSMLAQNPGRPLAPAAIQQMRQNAPVQRPVVRVINPTQQRPGIPRQPNAAQPGIGQPRPAQSVPNRPVQPAPAYRPPQPPVTPANRPPQEATSPYRPPQQPSTPAYRPPQQPSTPANRPPQQQAAPPYRPPQQPSRSPEQQQAAPPYRQPQQPSTPANRPAERPQTRQPERVSPPPERQTESAPRSNRPPQEKPQKKEEKKPE